MLLFIGNTPLPQMGSKETFRTDRNDVYAIEGWDMETNNISVTVYQSAGSQTACEVKFPQKGAVLSLRCGMAPEHSDGRLLKREHWIKGKRHARKRDKALSNREKGTGVLDSGGRPH